MRYDAHLHAGGDGTDRVAVGVDRQRVRRIIGDVVDRTFLRPTGDVGIIMSALRALHVFVRARRKRRAGERDRPGRRTRVRPAGGRTDIGRRTGERNRQVRVRVR